MGYVIFLIVATIFGGGIPGFLIGLGLIAFWVWTGSMGNSNSSINDNTTEAQSQRTSQSLIRRLEPCIDILCTYALRYEPQWTTAKVQFVKNSFIHLCENAEDQAYLRDRLKYENRPTLSYSCQIWLEEHRPTQNDLEVIYSKVCLLLVNTCPEVDIIKKEAFRFGTSIGLNFDYCDHVLSEMLEEHAQYSQQHQQNYHEPNEHVLSEKQKAAEILGIQADATREEIQKAYRIKIKEFHPDRNVNVTDAVRKMLEEQAHLINNARDTLLKD